MNVESFSPIRAQHPVALIDLAEAMTPEAIGSFTTQTARLAEESGGRVILANKAITSMIVPDESAKESDHAIRVLVVTDYPTGEAAEVALAKRRNEDPQFTGGQVRTFAAHPTGRLESLFGRTLPRTLGRLKRKHVPEIDDAEEFETLINGSLILGEEPSKARGVRLAQCAGNRPIWMLNFLEFAKRAIYADDPQRAAPAAPISGARAYRRYGSGMISSLAAVGGRVGWSGRILGQLEGRDDGPWHQVAIAVYPSPAAMMTMLAQPKYRVAHVHRAAALARTRLLATQPIEMLP